MIADLAEVKAIKPRHFLVAIAGSGLIPLTFTQRFESGGHFTEISRSWYLGFFAVLLWVMKTFDLNPGRALARGKWVLLVGLITLRATHVMGF